MGLVKEVNSLTYIVKTRHYLIIQLVTIIKHLLHRFSEVIELNRVTLTILTQGIHM